VGEGGIRGHPSLSVRHRADLRVDRWFRACIPSRVISQGLEHSPLDLSGLLVPVHLWDGPDLCYVKDTGRAIALLQLAETLNHRTYNVASGRVTTNADIIAAIHDVDPSVTLELPDGPSNPGNPLDIARLHHDTGYTPEYDTASAAADYIGWLRAGHDR